MAMCTCADRHHVSTEQSAAALTALPPRQGGGCGRRCARAGR